MEFHHIRSACCIHAHSNQILIRGWQLSITLLFIDNVYNHSGWLRSLAIDCNMARPNHLYTCTAVISTGRIQESLARNAQHLLWLCNFAYHGRYDPCKPYSLPGGPITQLKSLRFRWRCYRYKCWRLLNLNPYSSSHPFSHVYHIARRWIFRRILFPENHRGYHNSKHCEPRDSGCHVQWVHYPSSTFSPLNTEPALSKLFSPF